MLFDTIPIPVFVVDKDRKIVKANQAALSSAIDPQEPVGKRPGEVLGCIHALDNPRGCGFAVACEQCGVRKQVIDTLSTGRSHRKKRHLVIVNDHGATTEYPLLASTALFNRGEERQCIIVVEEISEIKSLERRVQNSERLFQAVLDSTEDWISIKDRNYRYTRVNAALAKSVGKPPEEIVGLSDFELLPKDMAEAIRKTDDIVLAGQRYRGEHERDIEGTTRRIESVKVPLKDDNGNIFGICAISRDVTLLRDASQQLENSARRMQQILDSAADGIYGIDNDGVCVFCNPTALRLLGFEKESDLVGKNVHATIHHSLPDGSALGEEDCPIHRMLAKGEQSSGEDIHFWRTDGTCFPVDYRVAPLRGGDSSVGSVISFSDISERVAMQEKADLPPISPPPWPSWERRSVF